MVPDRPGGRSSGQPNHQPNHQRPPYWNWIWALLGVALVIRTGVRDRGVIADHLEFGRRLLEGLELYAPYLDGDRPLHPPYPPSFGLLTAPFSLLPERLARFAWGLLQVGSLWWIALRLRDYLVAIDVPGMRAHVDKLWLFTAVLASRYVLRDTHGGGGNIINLALVLAALHLAAAALHRDGRGREIGAGLVLGFSLATKPVALLFVPLLWVFGHRRAPGVALLTATACMALALLALRQGMAPFLTWFDGSVRYAAMQDLFAEPAQGFPPFTWMNQCLRCAVARYFGSVPVELAAEVPGGFFPGLGLAPWATTWIYRLAAALLLALTAVIVWRRRKVAAARPWLVAATLALSLLLSPISWKAHHVGLIPAFFLIGLAALQGARWAWVVAVIYVPLCVLGEELVGDAGKELQQSLYLTTLGTLLVLGVCLARACAAKAPRTLPTEAGAG